MSKKILTIVVPSYNVEAYLEEGLESFIHPEIMEDIEVLIVNDGSSDATEAIGKQYELRYPQTFRVITKENGGHGSTINRGIKEAKGMYFKVVDGDDWVDTENFCRLVKMLKRVDVDVLGSNYTMIDDRTKRPAKLQEQPFKGLEYGRVYTFEEIVGKTTVPMHAMTIKTELLRKMRVQLDEHMFYVDMEYITFPMPYVKTFLFIEPSVYRYRLGLPNQSMSIKKMQSNLKNHLHVLLRLQRYAEHMEGKATDAQKAYMNDILGWMIGSQMKIYISFPLGSGMRKEAMKLDAYMKRKNPGAWHSVKNKAVWLLRYSHFMLFPAAVLAFRYRRNSY